MTDEVQTNESIEQDSGSLLDAETTENTEAETTQESKQELLAGKYKTTEELAKGYKNAESELGKTKQDLKKFQQQLKEFEVPEEYAFGEDIKFEDGDKEVWVNLGKQANLSQPQLDTVMRVYNEQGQVSNERISQELGAEKNEVLASLQKYAKGLNNQERSVLEGMLTSADAYRLLKNMVSQKVISVPNQKNVTTTPALSSAELHEKYNGVGNMNKEQFQEYQQAIMSENNG
jgi:hypothetical protein